MKNENVLRSLVKSFELPEDFAVRGHIELLGREKAIISDVRAIVTYESDLLVMVLPWGKLRITGKGLIVEMFTEKQVSVRGKLFGIEFDEVE